MKHLIKTATTFCLSAIGMLAMMSCEGADLYKVSAPDWLADKELPEELIGLSYALARGMGEDGSLHPQSYQIQSMVWRQKTELQFMHRGGKYIKPTEVFGPGVFYQQ